MCAVKQISCIHIVPTWFLIKIYLWIWVSVRFCLILFHQNVSMASHFNFSSLKAPFILLTLYILAHSYMQWSLHCKTFIMEMFLRKRWWFISRDKRRLTTHATAREMTEWKNLQICLSLLSFTPRSYRNLIWIHKKSVCVSLSLS